MFMGSGVTGTSASSYRMSTPNIYFRSWLVQQTFLRQKLEERLSLPKITVKTDVESEFGDIADLEIMSGDVEDSISCETVRRSARKRSTSRSPPVEDIQSAKKARSLTAAIAIRDPEDMMLMDVKQVYTSSSNKEARFGSFGVPIKLNDSELLDLNYNCQVDSETVSNDLADECKTTCQECRKTFKVSYFKFHVKTIHGVSVEDYLEVHGDPETGKMKLSTTCYHFCSFCNQKLLLIRSEIEKHVVTEHQVSLKTYVGKALENKTKDGNDNLVGSSNEYVADDGDVTSECLISSSDEDVRDETKGYGVNVKSTLDFGTDDEAVISECVISSNDEVENDETDQQKIKPIPATTVPRIPKSANSIGKTYSDSYDDSCIVECSVCDKQMTIQRLRSHTSSQHQMPITKYKDHFGGLTFIRQSFHLCNLCGREVQLDSDSIATHVRSSHKWSVKQYNAAHMVKRKSKVGQEGLKVDESFLLFQSEDNFSQNQGTGTGVVETSSSTEQQWFDGNTFTCTLCLFTNSSLDNFKNHVKSAHKTSLSKFSRWYSKTDIQYQCQCCDKKVYHDRSSIQAHVEGHLLSMEQYASLYERRKLQKEKEEKEKIEAVNSELIQELQCLEVAGNEPFEAGNEPFETENVDNFDPFASQSVNSQDPSTIKSPASSSVAFLRPALFSVLDINEEIPGHDKKLGEFQFIADIVDSIIPPFDTSGAGTEVVVKNKSSVKQSPTDNVDDPPCSVSSIYLDTSFTYNPSSPPPLLTSSPVRESVPLTPSTPPLPDIFIYMCPFPDCDFQTDLQVRHAAWCACIILILQGMQTGPAAQHGISVHKTDPDQIKRRGLRWKKVSLEMRMEQIFAED
jgi:hypothetical protein